MAKQEKFRFKKSDSIGAAAAEQDAQLLESCFVNTGDLDLLRDCASPRRIVVGRTGAGKTALLTKLLASETRTILVQPESLALAHISNSTILRFFSELGVKLDIFFRLLWRHVLTVEIIKTHFQIDDEAAKRSFLDRLFDRFRDARHRRAVEYIEKWGQHFWEDTEYRIQEVTTTLEGSLKSSIGAKYSNFSFGVEDAAKLSSTEKAELIQRAQKVVNEVQIKELSEVLRFLDDVLDDRQKRYFIVIDRLDEDWIEENLRLRLIRALVETVKDFVQVKNAKVVIAVRFDLLERVFRRTRDAGFQEEKFESLYLRVEWNRELLTSVLNTRISKLIEGRFAKIDVKWQDIMVKEIDKQSTIDYLLARTMMRPRDLIQFFNFCIAKASDRPQITAQMIREGEGEYSRDRLRSLADEWFADYPNLPEFVQLLEGKQRCFVLSSIPEEECCNLALNFLTRPQIYKDELEQVAAMLIEQKTDVNEFRRIVIYVLYTVGIVGLKTQTNEQPSWTTTGRRAVSRSEVREDARVWVHPMFWRVLHSRP